MDKSAKNFSLDRGLETKNNQNGSIKKKPGIMHLVGAQKNLSIDSIPKLQAVMRSYFDKVSGYIRRSINNNININLYSLEMVKWGDLKNYLRIKNAGVGVLFQIEQMHSDCALVFKESLIYYLLEHVLGGNPEKNPLIIQDRKFSPMEMTMFEDISSSIFKKFIEVVSQYMDMKYSFDKIESNPEYLFSFDQSENVVHMSVDFLQGEKDMGRMEFIIPANAFNYIRNHLVQNEKSIDIDDEWHNSIEEIVNSIELDISAEMNNTSLSLHNVSKLQVGDTIIIDREVEDEVEIKVGGHLIGYGKLGKVKDRVAIQVSSIFSKYEGN